MSTPVLMCMHVPIYRKPVQNPNYYLDGFYKVTATTVSYTHLTMPTILLV